MTDTPVAGEPAAAPPTPVPPLPVPPVLGLDAYGTSRTSRLDPAGPFLVHADLHNHTRLSDGQGDPRQAFGSLRAAGLDVAALTDHAVLAAGLTDLVDLPFLSRFSGIDERAWQQLRELADAAQEDGTFVALRGFEWSHPLLGHVNVWFTEQYTDPLHTLGRNLSPLYRWLASPERASGLAGFNHPGSRGGPFVFADFALDAAVRDQFVGMEMFNKRLDYLFQNTDAGGTSPLVLCLGAGWRPGLTGVSDEHGSDWGFPEGKGRTGLYVRALTREAVREALLARRCFATRLKGLRVDARLGGVPMGGAVPPSRGPLRLEVDVDRGGSWWHRPLRLQVLRPGGKLPSVALAADVLVPRPDEPYLAFDVDVRAEDGDWVVLRLSDPTERADERAQREWAGYGSAVAYCSPWWLEPPV